MLDLLVPPGSPEHHIHIEAVRNVFDRLEARPGGLRALPQGPKVRDLPAVRARQRRRVQMDARDTELLRIGDVLVRQRRDLPKGDTHPALPVHGQNDRCLCGQPAIDLDVGASDEACAWSGEERDDVPDLLGPTDPSDRMRTTPLFDQLFGCTIPAKEDRPPSAASACRSTPDRPR